MMNIKKRLRLLELYAVCSLAIICILLFSGWSQAKQEFGEIDVERINVKEKDGKLVWVVANSDRMPGAILDGKTYDIGKRPPGMLFYNGLGDENGGLLFDAIKKGKGEYGAYQGLTFDKYQQTQTMALIYNDHSGKYRAGFHVWERPDTPLADIFKRQKQIQKMPKGAAKTAAIAELKKENFSPTRIYVGRNKEKESEVTLYDGDGKKRIKMSVSENGDPKLDFLDSSGNVIYSLPKDGRINVK